VGFDFQDSKNEQTERKKKYEKAIKDYFKPEVFNRLSKIVVFNDLCKDDLINIIDLELKPLSSRLLKKNVKLTVNKKVKDYILEHSDDKTGNLGARPIKRSIENNLNDPIADIILEKGDKLKEISVTIVDNKLSFKTKEYK